MFGCVISIRRFHVPVLLPQAISYLQIKNGGNYLDVTLGGGGHSFEILKQSSPNGILLGIDRDSEAILAASHKLKEFGNNRVTIVKGNHDDIDEILKKNSILPKKYSSQQNTFFELFDGIIMDLGVSSTQLDKAERGFSLRTDGPLDMRMDQSSGVPVSEWLNLITETQLTQILQEYGEEPKAKTIARAIMKGRPWNSTLKLAQCVKDASQYKDSRHHPATRTFQALRIAVNNELINTEKTLNYLVSILKNNGRLVVISFHSLEDRIVKKVFQNLSNDSDNEKDFDNSNKNKIKMGNIVTKKAIKGEVEDPENPRARSAKLRVFERKI